LTQLLMETPTYNVVPAATFLKCYNKNNKIPQIDTVDDDGFWM